jgi:hypothetical protein
MSIPQSAAASSSSSAQDPQAYIADLMAKGTAVTNDYHRLQATHNQVVAERNALQQKVAVAEAKVHRPKLATPPSFRGDAAKVDEWVHTMEQYIDYYGVQSFPSEAEKVKFAAMCLQDKAAQWWRAYTADLALKGQAIDTWDEFTEELRKRFRPIEASVAARMNLDRLHMTGAADGYTELFYKYLLQIPDMGVADQMHAYIRGLKDYLRVEVLKARPKTLQEAVNKAKLAEAYFGNAEGCSWIPILRSSGIHGRWKSRRWRQWHCDGYQQHQSGAVRCYVGAGVFRSPTGL